MAIAADFSIAANGDIRYTGAGPNYTVLEMHRWLGDLMDDGQASGNDIMDITDSTASDRSTDNYVTLLSPYNIDATAAEHLYDGSIVQGGGTDIWDGIECYAPAGTYLELIQNGALIAANFWTTGLNADAINGISHSFMIKTRTAGADIDNRTLLGQTREFGQSYSEFRINATKRGNNTLALTYANDLNNETIAATVAGWTTITNTTEGFASLDMDGDSVTEDYYSEWNKDTYTINQFFERMKWLTRRGSASTLYGLNGELFRGITHEIVVDTPVGTFNAFEAVSWTGGTGQMLAINSTTAATKMWIQLLTGVAPSDGDVITGGTSAATVTMNVTVTTRTLSLPFCGSATGSAIIGAYGLGMEITDVTSSDKFTDLTDTLRVPPNNVTYNVSGVVIGEDRLIVTNDNGGAIDFAQLTLNTSLVGVAETAIVCTAAIPTDTPTTGTIRVELDSGIYRRIVYTSYTGSTFTIASTDFSTDNATSTNNIFISYIDKLVTATAESFTGVFLATRTMFVRARDGGGTPTKTFETTGALTSTGGSTVVNRTSDA